MCVSCARARREANAFARELLMPELLVHQQAGATGCNLSLMAKRFEVSVPAIRLRLLTLGLLPTWMRQGDAPMRIVHLSDTHLGFRQLQRINDHGRNEREQDVYDAFNAAIDRTIELAPAAVVHAGDLFDSYHPSSAALGVALDGLARLRAGRHPLRRYRRQPLDATRQRGRSRLRGARAL